MNNEGRNDLQQDGVCEDQIILDLSDSSQSYTLDSNIDVNSKSFQKEVDKKMKRYFFRKEDAETEEWLDSIIKQEENREDLALFSILSNKEVDDEKMQKLITCLLHRNVDLSVKDEEGETPLHFAVKGKNKSVCIMLLDYGAKADARDRNEVLPYTLALQDRNDDIAAMLIRSMDNELVRELYSSSEEDKNPEFSFHDLLEKDEMPETVIAVLDCMIVPKSGKVIVYYNVLEGNKDGKPPTFDSESKTGLQIIAQKGNKTIVNHDVVRLLIRRKWKKYARYQFLQHTLLNIITLVTITFSAIVASTAQDPTAYNVTALQIARGICEVWSLGMTIFTLATEIFQLRRSRLDYFKDASNWVDIASCCLILLLPPLRFTHRNEQWFVFSAAYLFWTARMLKFATVFRKSGAYVLILWRIIKHDILEFTIFFLFILLAFSGCLLLSLRGEDSLEQFSESSTFWSILFVGIRILIEGERILEYTEFQTISLLIMVGFLFTICIVLLNILIAQVSDTYQNVQQDAQRVFEVNRASIVARGEQNSLCFCKAYRTDNYTVLEEFDDTEEFFKKSPKNRNGRIQDIGERLESFEKDFRNVSMRLYRQETILEYLMKSLNNESTNEHIMESLDTYL